MNRHNSVEGTGVLSSTIQELARARDIESITRIIRTAARTIAAADGAAFVLKENGYCYYADEEAIAPLWKGQRFPCTTCVSGWCMMNAASVVIPDITKDPRIPPGLYDETFVKSMAMTPIRERDPLGAIGVYWDRPFEASPALIEMLRALSEAVATAIENIQMRDALTARIRSLEEESRTKDQYMLEVSKELRNPLTTILGWAELLNEGAVTPEELPEVYATLFRNARAQTQIVGNILQSADPSRAG